MCGIAGFLDRTGARTIDAARLARMRDTLLHRGPDGAGLELFDGGRAGLAHRRLAILDLGATAHQPMPYADGRYWLSFNGEIYNFRELRAELEGRGHRFRSSGDAEVLVAAFAEWGEACVERLRGMWGFAIWDEREKTLFCSRDRFGIKPFYYFDDGGLFVFGSEIRAVLASGCVAPTPRPESMAAYLSSLPLVDGLEETWFEGVRRLPAAHCLVVSSDGTRRRRYWEPRPAGYGAPAEGAGQALLEHLDAAVRSHLVSDAPLGVSLSGGLDSTSILALAARVTGPGLRAYTGVYDDRYWDERRWSDATAELCKAEAVHVAPERGRFLDLLPRIAWHLEEPPLRRGVYTRWWVSERASRDVKVLLSGQGADELLAGYPRYDALMQWDHLARGRLLRFAREIRPTIRREGLRRAAAAVRDAARGRAHTGHMALGGRLRDVALPLHPPPRVDPRGGRSALNERLHYDVACFLPELLRYDDRIHMAHSIECRVPFLDQAVAELAFALPPHAKIRDGWRKIVLREAMEGLVPRPVQWRRAKRPFGMPEEEWRGGALLAQVKSRVLDGPAVRDGWLDRADVERTLAGHRLGAQRHGDHLWRWLWLTTWIDLHAQLADRSWAAAPLHRNAG